MKMNKIMSVLIMLLCLRAESSAGAPVDLEMLYGPRVDKLCMVIITNEAARIMAVESGAVDMVSDLARPSDIERLARSGAVDMSLARGYHAFFMMMNNRAEPWNSAAVRRAALLAVDRSNIVRNIFSGYCEPINSWLPPVSPWALAGDGRNRFDQRAARLLLAEAGYSWNLAGRLVAPDGRPLEKIKLVTPLARVAPTSNEVAERVADSLSAVGFPVDVEPMDFATMISRLDRSDYSLCVIAWSLFSTPISLYNFYHSSNDVEGGYNRTGTSDPLLDEALEELKFAANKEEAQRAARPSCCWRSWCPQCPSTAVSPYQRSPTNGKMC